VEATHRIVHGEGDGVELPERANVVLVQRVELHRQRLLRRVFILQLRLHCRRSPPPLSTVLPTTGSRRLSYRPAFEFADHVCATKL